MEENRRSKQAISTGGLSTSRLGRLHQVMAGNVERGDVPGPVTLVCRRGEVHIDAIGTTPLSGRSPLQHGTIFRISSMTKPIMATAMMILDEEGVLPAPPRVGIIRPAHGGAPVVVLDALPHLAALAPAAA